MAAARAHASAIFWAWRCEASRSPVSTTRPTIPTSTGAVRTKMARVLAGRFCCVCLARFKKRMVVLLMGDGHHGRGCQRVGTAAEDKTENGGPGSAHGHTNSLFHGVAAVDPFVLDLDRAAVHSHEVGCDGLRL